MGKTVGAYEAKSRFAELLNDVSRGVEVTITRRGEPVALLIPFGDARARRREALERWSKAKHEAIERGDIKPATRDEVVGWVREGRRF